MLKAENISYTINHQKILEDVSLHIKSGDFTALMGPNGAGKTTLLKILSHSIHDYQGSIFLNDEPLKKSKPKHIAKIMAVVSQENYFAFSFSVFEVVLMGRNNFIKKFGFETEEDYIQAEKAMKITDCFHLKNRDINTLSGGEKQRVLLARALCQNPKILILDEPASHLDLKHQKDLFDLLKQLNEDENLTIVCVMHNLNEALKYCKKAVLLKSGRVVHLGLSRDVLTTENIQAVFKVDYQFVKSKTGHDYLVPL